MREFLLLLQFNRLDQIDETRALKLVHRHDANEKYIYINVCMGILVPASMQL